MLRPALRYVALGDSYTIGTSVVPADRWPDQLVARLASAWEGSRRSTLVDNLGVNGSTSDDVIRRELPRLWPLRPEFVSLLIGVNDVVQGGAHRCVSRGTWRRSSTRSWCASRRIAC